MSYIKLLSKCLYPKKPPPALKCPWLGAWCMIDEPIILGENKKIFRRNAENRKKFNDYLVNIADELDVYNWGEDVSYYLKLTSRMSVFNNHRSIRLIKYKYHQSLDFQFEFVSTNQVLECVNEIDCKKSSGDIPTKIIKLAKEEFTEPITNCMNKCMSSSTFPDVLKIPDIIPVYKKQDMSDKTNC